MFNLIWSVVGRNGVYRENAVKRAQDGACVKTKGIIWNITLVSSGWQIHLRDWLHNEDRLLENSLPFHLCPQHPQTSMLA